MSRTLLRKILLRFPALSQNLRVARDLLDRKAPSSVTTWGFTLAGHSGMASGSYEPHETGLVRQLLEEVDTLVNVGANVGYYCCHALSMGRKVIAVEPIPRNVFYLLKNMRNNGWARQAEVYPVALGERVDILEMWGGGTGASLVKGWASIPESYVTHVPVLTLDRLLGGTLVGKRALILVDVEGAEFSLLQGGRNTLMNDPAPIWLMEITTTEHQPENGRMNPNFRNTFELFFEYGYRAFTVQESPKEIFLSDIAKTEKDQTPMDAHNFLFRT